MLAGLAHFKKGDLVLTVLAPVALGLLIHAVAGAYCRQIDQHNANRRRQLDAFPAMESASLQADRALGGFLCNRRFTPGGTEEIGRWLREVGKKRGVQLQSVAVSKNGMADALVTAYMATFRVEGHLGVILPFLRDLQSDDCPIAFDQLRFRRSDTQRGLAYSVDVALHAYVLTLPAAGAEKGRAP